MPYIGLADSQVIGSFGEDDAKDILQSTFARVEISAEYPDAGTDLICKIPSDNTNYYPIEWRIQVKATTGQYVNLNPRRGELVLNSPPLTWLLFVVKYQESPSSDTNSHERRSRSRFYIYDLRSIFIHRLKEGINLSNHESPIRVKFDDRNLLTRNLLVHLWSVCLWHQIIYIFNGISSNLDSQIDPRVLAQARQMMGRTLPATRLNASSISRVTDVNAIIESVDIERRRSIVIPMHSYYGARVVVERHVKKPIASDTTRAFSRIDKIDHVLCWIFSFWYWHYNNAAIQASSGKFMRIFELGNILGMPFHQRMLAWQMLKAQISQGVRIRLVRNERLDGIESRTIFWPYLISSTSFYSNTGDMNTTFNRFRKSSDPIDWKHYNENSIQVNNIVDLYGDGCLEMFGLRATPKKELIGLAEPGFLLPKWWLSCYNAMPIVAT